MTQPSTLKQRTSPTPMASSDPQTSNDGRGEDEPLLGRAGDASQQEGGSIINNVVIGTAVIAQAGIWIFTAVVWGSILSSKARGQLFAAHPVCLLPGSTSCDDLGLTTLSPK